MSKIIVPRHTPVSSLLKNMQCRSLLDGERRTTILNLTVVGETLSDLDLNCADFLNSEVSDSTFYNCDLRGASFRESRLERVKFVNCSICDMELPEDFSSITFHNCSSLPSGLLEASTTAKERPNTIYDKILNLIESTGKVTSSLSTEKLLSLAVILAFIAIIFVVALIRK